MSEQSTQNTASSGALILFCLNCLDPHSDLFTMRLLEKDVFLTISCGAALFLIVCLLFQEILGKRKDLSASNDSLSENTKVRLFITCCHFFFFSCI